MVFSSLAITIRLDRLDGRYTSSDTITGTVSYTVKDKVDITSVEVRLLGRARCTVLQGGTSPTIREEIHRLCEVATTVFPPAHIQEAKDRAALTLLEGTYTYPFAVQVPCEDFVIDCETRARIYHTRFYSKAERKEAATTLPPSMEYHGDVHYAMVEYHVCAIVNKPAFYKINPQAKQRVEMVPHNRALRLPVSHICSTKNKHSELLPNMDSFPFTIAFSNEGAGDGKRKFWQKLLTSSKFQVPFELQVQFKLREGFETIYGTSSRVVEGNSALEDYVSLSLVTPLSYDDMRSLLGSANIPEKAPLGHVREVPKLIVEHLKIVLSKKVVFGMETTEKFVDDETLVSTALNATIDLSDFERISPAEAGSIDLSKKQYRRKSIQPYMGSGGSSTASGSKKDAFYKFEFPQEWVQSQIGPQLQSFLVCNIRHTAKLKVTVTFSTTSSATAGQIVARGKAHVLTVNNEGTGNRVAEPAPAYESVGYSMDQGLPSYQP